MSLSARIDYLKLLAVVKLMRGFTAFGKTIGRATGAIESLTADDHFNVKSKDGARSLRVNVYRNALAKASSQDEQTPAAVYINWHGGGWLLANQGDDVGFIQALLHSPELSLQPFIVLDADYAHAPEYPYPIPVEDAVQLILHVFANPKAYDSQKVVIGGFSSGATIALGSSLHFAGSSGANGKQLKGVIAFYPPVDVTPPDQQQAPEPDVKTPPANFPGVVLPPWVGIISRYSYLYPPNYVSSKKEQEEYALKTSREPTASPLFAAPTSFPPNLMLITCEYDGLMPAAEKMRRKLQDEGHGVTTVHGGMVEGVGHGWDKMVKEGQVGWNERVKWYEECAKFIARSVG